MVKSVFASNNPAKIDYVYGAGRKARVGELTDLYPVTITEDNFEAHRAKLQEVEVVFSTWGLTQALAIKLAELPSMKAVFYGAGSVQGFARPLLERDIVVMSAWAANAVPVAQFTLAQMLLGLKCYHLSMRERHAPATQGHWLDIQPPGIFNETVGLLGCGMIGSLVAEYLKPYNLRVLAYDLHWPEGKAESLGVKPADPTTIFRESFVVSNHLPNLPATVKTLHGGLFETLRPNATFINTGRGATVNEADLLRVMRGRPDLTALLDVTHPEPPPPGSPLYSTPNIYLTPHTAGAIGHEVVRMADYTLEAFAAYERGNPVPWQVTSPMLETMA